MIPRSLPTRPNCRRRARCARPRRRPGAGRGAVVGPHTRAGGRDLAAGATGVLFTTGGGGVVAYNPPGAGCASPLLGARLYAADQPRGARTLAPRLRPGRDVWGARRETVNQPGAVSSLTHQVA
jgi:hypothetical protein